MPKSMTWQQAERQSTRTPSGKYAQMTRCEECGRPTGANYYSLPDCNETGKGLVLCKKCEQQLRESKSMDTAEIHDCPTCRHTWEAGCKADGYQRLSWREQTEHWKKSEVPCRFWEKEEETCPSQTTT